MNPPKFKPGDLVRRNPRYLDRNGFSEAARRYKKDPKGIFEVSVGVTNIDCILITGMGSIHWVAGYFEYALPEKDLDDYL